MKSLNVVEKIKMILEPKKKALNARLFVARQDGITIYDSIQDKTTASVSALVSGVWQASEALMSLVYQQNDIMDFRLGFDTSSQGIYLFPFTIEGKRYFLGAIYENCLSPGLLKRQIAMIKEEMDRFFEAEPIIKKKEKPTREGFLFQEITDEEIDRLFSVGGI